MVGNNFTMLTFIYSWQFLISVISIIMASHVEPSSVPEDHGLNIRKIKKDI